MDISIIYPKTHLPNLRLHFPTAFFWTPSLACLVDISNIPRPKLNPQSFYPTSPTHNLSHFRWCQFHFSICSGQRPWLIPFSHSPYPICHKSLIAQPSKTHPEPDHFWLPALLLVWPSIDSRVLPWLSWWSLSGPSTSAFAPKFSSKQPELSFLSVRWWYSPIQTLHWFSIPIRVKSKILVAIYNHPLPLHLCPLPSLFAFSFHPVTLFVFSPISSP